jgi:peptide methionine sulfoxide reductase msrA/msrB
MSTRIIFLINLLIISIAGCTQTPPRISDNLNRAMGYKELTKEEEHIIIHKGTEPPFSGKYEKHNEPGTYTCKRCGASLFGSDNKFDAHCGWPSFDDEIQGAVKQIPDTDGMRTEIVCSNCGAHLGHVFTGEGFTPKNTRHCVNSVSLDFIPESNTGSTDTALYAGGCFWGVEYYMMKTKGVISTEVGYTGGHLNNPTYKEVCSGNTGHYEAIEVVFDPSQTSYETITKLFFEIHDPTQWNHQGPDHGEQYRSAVFYKNKNQKNITEKLINELKSKGFHVVTEVKPAEKFWKAEDYHQEYYEHKGTTPYCHGYVKRF